MRRASSWAFSRKELARPGYCWGASAYMLDTRACLLVAVRQRPARADRSARFQVFSAAHLTPMIFRVARPAGGWTWTTVLGRRWTSTELRPGIIRRARSIGTGEGPYILEQLCDAWLHPMKIFHSETGRNSSVDSKIRIPDSSRQCPLVFSHLARGHAYVHALHDQINARSTTRSAGARSCQNIKSSAYPCTGVACIGRSHARAHNFF
jgi:hypothetical protein